jgi:hypothetical protein
MIKEQALEGGISCLTERSPATIWHMYEAAPAHHVMMEAWYYCIYSYGWCSVSKVFSRDTYVRDLKCNITGIATSVCELVFQNLAKGRKTRREDLD